MGDWYGTAALILAVVVFVAGVYVWERRGTAGNPSPTPPLAEDLEEFPQVDEPQKPIVQRQGRGGERRLDTSPKGVRGAWIRPTSGDWDDDDDD
ncbi:hypothetical protein Drose_04035 [Dactylosporangium roseum]|uniref:Secreted protein n=1 Tax=Dactylosporangium roseum TaxID=47989 RepID=A0ABY5Z9S2_9ACTN|nr:hypothetical protein [Dactylosporangium roseum]UWZ37458.1 hypothetical protein Drose_04035 [Dactylosporangium roseum]